MSGAGDAIVTRIVYVARDGILPARPYVQKPPRTWNSLVYITGGAARMTAGDLRAEYREGELLFFRSGLLNTSEALGNEPNTYIYVNFETMDDDVFDSPPFAPIRVVAGRHYAHDFEQMLHVWQGQEPGYALRVRETIYRALAGILETAPSDGRAREAGVYLQEHFGDPELCVASLAEAVRLSPRQLTRVFLREYGLPPGEYLARLRIRAARELLQNMNNTIGEVAERTGFRDIYAFSRAFRKRMAVSPAKWRGGKA